jgi:hypothetical protein
VAGEFLQTRRLFVIVVVLGLFAMAARSVADPDVWWHLRTGQLILQNHRIFHTDPYSFTKLGQRWIDHEWLSQVFIFGLYRLAGWGGLIAGFAVIIAAAFGIVFVRSSGRPYIAGVMTVWGALASVPSWGVRPQMFTLLLASLLLFLLEHSYRRPRVLWWIPPLILLWVNLHGGYALGIAFIVLFLVGDAIDLALGYDEASSASARFRTLGLVLAISLAVVPLNPYGTAMYRYPLATVHSRAMLAYIGEWLSPNFHESRYLPALLMMLGTILLSALSPRRLHARELLLLAVTMYAALRSVRHIPIYVLVAVPLLSALAEAQLQACRKAALFAGTPLPLTRIKLMLNTALLAGLIVFVALRFRYVVSQQGNVESSNFPEAAVSFLAQSGPPGPIFNHYNWGGYLIWKLYPGAKVYIDGRADLYGDSFLDNFAETYYVRGTKWRTPLEAWSIETVILPPDAPLVGVLQTVSKWRKIFADSQAVILTRRPEGS